MDRLTAGKMHAHEIETDISFVRRLLAAQFPQWADLSIEPISSAGTDNALYRLGDDMAVRLPRIRSAVGDVEREQQWLPKLAPFLPLATPVPLAKGQPGEGYPWHWSIYRWLEGEEATIERIADQHQAAIDLAGFITALQRVDTTGAPLAGRGVPLAKRDAYTREAIEALRGIIDIEAATAAWEAALGTPIWDGPPLWVHGD
jgi:aminoglycoside phosphotransferase (APT) family kinase protein